ncbi:UNVERIFIED_ORG: transglutaminase-like putative cysteine protease [Xanthobacter viscosus]|uniref:Transglutaminase domain-containing protein n=1 Tax=Xanthobacter autotrophicus TaxID=280 RepID=A0A6C1K8Z0_XANAU|nr:transglutaminase-like domain-containing protein [Xanthobacter autotrophicus]TLX40749.1 transglutaminase domain-containing protein [Xanthobacter autotrophicus]
MTTRRDLLKAGALATAAAVLPRAAFAQQAAAPQTFAPAVGKWRSYQIVTTVEILKPEGQVQAWLPVASFSNPDWFKPGENSWTTNARSAQLVRDPHSGADMLHLVFADGEKAPRVELTSRATSRDWAVDLTKPGKPAPLAAAARARNIASTDLIPTDGIVKATSDKIVAGKSGELEKVRAIFEWIVENTYRNPTTRGCGIGDIAALLKSGDLGGKCADLNALFVGLVRAQDIPARDVYGLRVVPSRFGYKSLGANSEIVTKAQHCRAEVFLSDFGWVPMDPADVRKVVLEEPPGKLALDDPKVVAARKALFGSWEGNWFAFNTAHDVALPGFAGPRLGFLMYPQAVNAAGLLDCLDPDNFKYVIRASEIAV